MKRNLLKHPTWVRYTLPFLLLVGLLTPSSVSNAVQTIEVIVEVPQLDPGYSSCESSFWDPIPNDRGSTTYLTLNVSSLAASTNSGEWRPNLPQNGYYRVEAYITAHDPIAWCSSGSLKEHDTTSAHYSIHHGNVVSNLTLSQHPLGNQWLDLGAYYFNAGNDGYVSLNDLSNESAYSTTVSFSAMRFTFTPPPNPAIYLPMINRSKPSGPLPADVGVVQAQGFDVCSLPSLSTMQTWWNASPYSFYGLYLGGVQLPTQCLRATASWVSAVHRQGWSFVPTWVGLQAPCTTYTSRMSSDPLVSYQQGRQEAQDASAAAASLGLTDNGLGGTIIYYDLEAYGFSSDACRQPVASFMNGWVERLHELGNLAGGYGTRNSFIFDWAYIANVPDAVWPAYWYADTYDPYASVTSIPWLQGLWTNHQRIRQYAGDHHESWGGIGIAIDSNVADGVVAMPTSGLAANPLIMSNPPVEDSGWLSAEQGWLVSEQQLYWTSDRGKNWANISPAAIQIAFFLPSGQAWAFSAINTNTPVFYTSSNLGLAWQSQALTLPAGDWRPLQLQFTSPESGWLVLQKVTGPAFKAGLLLQTGDGGLTWQTHDLPTAGKINFTDPLDGWLVNDDREQLFRTTDGGISWQSAKPSDVSPVKLSMPAGTDLSGWHSDMLGWASTTNGSCQGEKSAPGFTCQVDHRLWQSVDGGTTWEVIPLPTSASQQ